MNPQQTQAPQQDMTADEAKASLGIATSLNQQFFNPPKQAEPTQSAPAGETAKKEPEPKDSKKEDQILSEIKSIRSELEALLNDENDEKAK